LKTCVALVETAQEKSYCREEHNHGERACYTYFDFFGHETILP
jgi:hypothetical protein